MLILPPCRSHVSVICVDDSDAQRRSGEKAGLQAIVEACAINRTGLMAAMCGPIAKQRFTIQTVTSSSLNTVTGGSVAYLGAHFRIGDTSESERPEAIRDAYEAIRDRLATLTRDPVTPIPAEDRLRFGLTMRDGRDTYGILAPVTSVLAEHQVDISWMAGAARESPFEMGRVVFAAEMKLEMSRHEADRVIPLLQGELDRLERSVQKARRSDLRINLHGLDGILV